MTDIHAHYDDPAFDADRETLLCSLADVKIITAGCDEASSRRAMALADKYPNVYFTAGVHPEFALLSDPTDWLTELVSHKKCVAVGEIGLDYHYDEPPRDAQQKMFELQLDFALSHSLPVVIHDRDAHADCLDAVLARPGLRGVFHSFSGSPETAAILRKAGFYISLSGVVTFKNAIKAQEVCRQIDLDGFLTETDCPYLTPHPFRGKRNDSSYISYTLEKIAEIKNITVKEAERHADANAAALFGI